MIIEHTQRLSALAQAGELLGGLQALYPDFGHWYTNQVMPGVLVGSDALLVAREGQRVVGVALGKKGKETKLRCVRVLPEYQSTGLGIKLIDRMLDVLECDKPHCTVAEEMLHLYSRPFVNRYGFSLDHVAKGMYRSGKLEYVFNG